MHRAIGLIDDEKPQLRGASCGSSDASVLNAHFADAHARRIAAGSRLWNQGDQRTHIMWLRSGAICFSRVLKDGRRVVTGFAYPGDLVGLIGGPQSFDAEAIQDCRLETMTCLAFRQAAITDPSLCQLAQREIADALASAQERVIVVTRLQAAERLAHFLVDLSERGRRRGNGTGSVLLPMRRLDIADFLGLTVETVSRVFTAFRKEGLIVMDQPSVVFIKRPDRLRALASGESDDGMPRAA